MKIPFRPLFHVQRNSAALAIVTVSMAGFDPLSAQTNGTWSLNDSGNWSDTANWSNGDVASGAGAVADFSTLDITADRTVTLDGAFTVGTITTGDLTTASHNWIFGGTGVLTLNNNVPSPIINVASQNAYITNPLAGSSGLTKAGAGVLYLSGNNSGLSGTLTIQDVAGTNNNGVVVTGNTAIGGITSVNIEGSGSTGGFFQLDGGVTLPSSVGITLNSPGGNVTPPGGIRSTGAGSVNTIEGAINVPLIGARISNNTAQRLDITGPISGTSTSILFRNAANEGIRLRGNNTYSAETINSAGILWFDSTTALPSGSLLSISASEPATVQFKGTFDRSLGNSGGQVRFSQLNANSSSRAMGLSARGGDLTVNFGGATAEIPFNDFTANPNGLASAINTSILWLNNPTATHKITIVNPLNLNGAARTFQVDANEAELQGGLVGTSAITKTGTGTLKITPALTLSAARTLTVSGGILELTGGFTGNAALTKAGTALLRVPAAFNIAAAQTVSVTGGNLELSGGLSGGASTVTKSGSGVLNLSGPSTWTGTITTLTDSSVNHGTVRVSHSLGLGPAATVKTLQMRGSNRATSILELSGGVDIDANKTLNMSGKSFYTSGQSSTGTQFSMNSVSGTNTWRGNIAIAETGGAYGIQSTTGSTLVIGANTATTSTIRNTADGSRPMGFFGGGDFVINSKIATNGSLLTGINMSGSGTLTLARTDNDFTIVPNLNSGTTVVTKMSLNNVASSIGTATSFNLGGTLRYTGSGDTSNRTIGLYAKGGTLTADGTGPLQLTSTSFSHLTGSLNALTAPYGNNVSTITVNDSSSFAVGQSIDGPGIAVGTTTITATNPGSRTITLSQPTTAGSTNSATLNIGNANDLNRTLTLNGSNTGENLLAANLSNPSGSGTLGITKSGSGRWVLSGATKTNTGSLDVQAGTLEIRNTGFPASSANVAAGSTLVLNNVGTSMNVTGTLNLDGRIVVSLPIDAAQGTYDVIQYGQLTGAGSISSPFRGVANIGTNSASFTTGEGISITWTGAESGIWDVNTSINWQDGSANPETFRYLDSVTFNSVGAAQPNVNIASEVRTGSIIVNEEIADYTLGGSGFISGTGSLTKSGAATLNLNTANTFVGNVTINGGTIKLGNTQALGANGKTITVASGGMLDLNGALTASRDYQAIISGTGVGNAGAITNSGANNNFGFKTLTLDGDATIGGAFRWDVRPITAGEANINLAGNTLTKTGANNVAFVDGTLTNDGVIHVNQGFLTFTRMVVSGNGNVNVNDGATLRLENNTTGSWSKPLIINNASINLLGSNYTMDGAVGLSNTATFNIASSQTLTLTQPVGGTGGLTMATGTGTLLLTADATYAGPTSINAGTLQVGTQGAPASLAPGAVTIGTGANLRINRGDSAYALSIGQISGAGRLLIGQSAAAVSPATTWDSLVTLSGSNAAFTGNVTVESGALRILSSGSLGEGSKTISLVNGTNGRPQLQLDGTAGDITLASNISFSTSSQNLTHPAIGNIAGNNQIDGNITLTSGGGSTAIRVMAGSLALNGNIASNTSGRTLTLGGNTDAPGVIHGVISNGTSPVAITKAESNTWTFTGTNTYTGITTINGGSLLFNGDQSAATGAVTVNNGATLGGTGITGAAVTVNAGGTIAPGASGIESLATGAVSFAAGSTLAVDINSSTATADQLIVTGGIDLTDTVNLTLNDLGANAPLPQGTKFTIADYTGAWDPADVLTFNGSPVPNGSSITLGANSFVVDYTDASLGGTAITLTVAGTGDPYTGWADTYSLTGADRAPGADPDHDGLENGIEFVIGSNPTANTPAGDRPAGNVIGGNLVFTFKRSDDSEAFDVFVEHGTNLIDWSGQIAIPSGAHSDANVTVINNDPGLDDVTVTIPVGTDMKKFARLRADIPFTP